MLSELAQKIHENLIARGYLRDGISVKRVFDELNESANLPIEKHDFEKACQELDDEVNFTLTQRAKLWARKSGPGVKVSLRRANTTSYV